MLKYPNFLNLQTGTAAIADANSVIFSPGPLAMAFDRFGNLFATDSLHRVAVHFQGFRVVNGAHYARARPQDAGLGQQLVAGMVTSIFSLGSDFASETRVFNELPNPIPLPTTLADTQVLVNDIPAPLYFVSPQQINFFVPTSIPESGPVEVQVIRPSVGQVLAVGCTTLQIAGTNTSDPSDDRYRCGGPPLADVASPAFFTRNSTGTGQIAALNEDGSVNSDSNPIRRSQVIQLFGTGQGRVPNMPPDGTPPSGEVRTEELPTVIMGAGQVPPANILYSGLAPGLVGVWQINVRVPDTVAPSNNTVVALVYRSRVSNLQNPTVITTTIAVAQ
jgi:uncharacterized protein (TIGR03437 family)